MESVTAITPTVSTTSGAESTGSSAVLSSDFETFLTLLTTQMENQDPLNPVDSSDFAVQLATFSNVEQQVMTNELLTEMSGRLGLDGMSQFADWIGKEARVASPAYYQGQALTLALEPEPLAEQAVLIVTDAAGAEVQRLDVAPQQASYSWSGQGQDGIPLADGLYRFELESRAGGQVIGRTTVGVYQAVIEARVGDGGTEIVLAGGAAVNASEVTALRAPG